MFYATGLALKNKASNKLTRAMKVTTPDVEQTFIYLMAILTVANLGISVYFTLETNFNLALFYMMGALMTTQFLMIYQETLSKRKTQAAIKLLENRLETEKENQ